MARQRATSVASENSSGNDRDQQELGRRVLSSQTIGVEFSSKIVRVGTGATRKRIKLQLWDTAGTERFRSVSRSYYRGAAGALLVYDVTSHASFDALPTFLNDAKALASPDLTVLLVGNKSDLSNGAGALRSDSQSDYSYPPPTPSSVSSKTSASTLRGIGTLRSNATTAGLGSQTAATEAPEGREVTAEEASRWASLSNVPVSVEASALSGENVDELFSRLARMILTKIELGEVDPDDPQSGIQYGDSDMWGAGAASDGGSIKSSMTVDGSGGGVGSTLRNRRRGPGRGRQNTASWMSGIGREGDAELAADTLGETCFGRNGCASLGAAIA
ncbi:MAG: hypothetical protein M1825_000589 [Sarcosagium campestre]|nr:MAG: hypothetical protein M1825_000589 [Sarcosagium campestre]